MPVPHYPSYPPYLSTVRHDERTLLVFSDKPVRRQSVLSPLALFAVDDHETLVIHL